MQMTLKHFKNILATVYFISAPHVRTAYMQGLHSVTVEMIDYSLHCLSGGQNNGVSTGCGIKIISKKTYKALCRERHNLNCSNLQHLLSVDIRPT